MKVAMRNCQNTLRSAFLRAANNSRTRSSTIISRSFSCAPAALRQPQDPFVSSSTTIVAITAASLIAYLSMGNERPKTWNHCQVPCGIFDDPAIVQEMQQACTTIRKAMTESKILHATMNVEPLAMNQIVRWIQTKEEHCNKIISLVSEYMLCQRVKRVNFATENEYMQALKLHHQVMQSAMKAKQSLHESDMDKLEQDVAQLAKLYTK